MLPKAIAGQQAQEHCQVNTIILSSDKHLTVNSNFTNNLLPGDIVPEDRGFNIEEVIAMKEASWRIPEFTRRKTQLSGGDVEMSRSIANVRIHVGRVIGF